MFKKSIIVILMIMMMMVSVVNAGCPDGWYSCTINGIRTCCQGNNIPGGVRGEISIDEHIMLAVVGSPWNVCIDNCNITYNNSPVCKYGSPSYNYLTCQKLRNDCYQRCTDIYGTGGVRWK